MNAIKFIETIKNTLSNLEKVGAIGYNILHTDYEHLSKFLNWINPQYTTDSVDVVDILHALTRYENLPSVPALNIIAETLKQAELDNKFGELSYRYVHPVLEAVVSFDDGKTAVISFIPSGKTPLSIPLEVQYTLYYDIYENSNDHDEYCDFRNYISSFCTCDGEVKRLIDKHTFKTREDFKNNAATWLRKCKYAD